MFKTSGPIQVVFYSASLLLFILTCTVQSRANPVQIIEHPALGQAVPLGITTGPDGALWFTDQDAYLIGRMTTAGIVTIYPLPSGSLGSSITTGPDGALWFTEALGGNIGRITTSGVVTEFPIPDSEGQMGIAAGSDGALWFTEYFANYIGRITTDGSVTEFPILMPGTGPCGITSGPDGALWFTEQNSPNIGRISTSGSITEFAIPENPPPYSLGGMGITTGSDGALWFATATYIGRITTQGVVSTFYTQSGGAGITSGPDGALWFSSLYPYNIGRVTTSGLFTSYSIPTPESDAQQITTGPNGALWFTEGEPPGSIGEIVSAAASLSVTPDTGSFGTNITVSGGGFAPGENVNLYAHSTGAGLIRTIPADAAGAFFLSTSIGAIPGGVHSLVGVGQSSDKIGVGHYTVTGLLSLTPNQGPPGANITATGYGLPRDFDLSFIFGERFLSSVHIDQTGSFSMTFTLPEFAPGTYSVSVDVSGDNPILAQTTFIVN